MFSPPRAGGEIGKNFLLAKISSYTVLGTMVYMTEIVIIGSVAGTRPCAPTLRELMRALRSKTAFWEDIGIELQISDDDLVQIKLENARDFRSCLREMLRKWLVHVNPRPAWTAIIEALEQLGDEELAGRLRSKYYTTSQ